MNVHILKNTLDLKLKQNKLLRSEYAFEYAK
jgi:hypothetical protein